MTRPRLNAPASDVPTIAPLGVYTLKTAAPLLHSSPRRVSKLVNAGAIAGREEGTRILILGEAILAYLRKPKTVGEVA